MDPVTLIVAALAAGAATGVGETATQAVRDAYASLRTAVAARFSGHPKAEQTLQDHADDPDAYEKPLARQIQATGTDRDPRIVALAEELIRLMTAEGAAGGSHGRYLVDLRDSRGVVVGDHNTQTNNFN